MALSNSHTEQYNPQTDFSIHNEDPSGDSEPLLEPTIQPEEELSIDEEYEQAETINDFMVLARKGYLPAAYDLVMIMYNEQRYEECSEFAYQCIDAEYRVDDVWDILSELPTCYWRRDYYEEQNL